MGRGEQLRTEEMMLLVLKAQSNHFYHLDQDLRNEMKGLREDFQGEMRTLREDMNKHLEQLMRRVDRFMFWSLGVTAAAAIFVVNYPK
uniref:Uncharacterized protein n=1 Tax=Candidatus Kentrum eta TaxID=2126337 RepID=A0A450UA37_9GAMM|nr:MAG: hypothetical protein BECKH772A_GA0070896_100124 [Candidatus Kentron sp. H]VFJ89806.1 MAG: hypothetical protein BECKH772B_GA0070898_1000654 [Candidatus Kentron sp. H]VFJ97135.1 MAG: hypothetical protein BECKH772C_GA0070978_100114 [Candidatus Kentron sp. H]